MGLKATYPVGRMLERTYEAGGDAVEVEIHERRREQGEHLAEDESANHGVDERLSQLGRLPVYQLRVQTF